MQTRMEAFALHITGVAFAKKVRYTTFIESDLLDNAWG